MNKKQQETVKAYHKACDGLARAVNDQLFDGFRSYYWVADEIGGVCDFGDSDFINAEDMAKILLHGITYDQYAEWREANLGNKNYINLRSWLRGLRHDMIKERKGVAATASETPPKKG